MFHNFLYDDSKQDDSTTTAHSKYFISFLKEENYLQHLSVQYGKTLMVVLNNTDVNLHYTLYNLYLSVTQLLFVKA